MAVAEYVAEIEPPTANWNGLGHSSKCAVRRVDVYNLVVGSLQEKRKGTATLSMKAKVLILLLPSLSTMYTCTKEVVKYSLLLKAERDTTRVESEVQDEVDDIFYKCGPNGVFRGIEDKIATLHSRTRTLCTKLHRSPSYCITTQTTKNRMTAHNSSALNHRTTILIKIILVDIILREEVILFRETRKLGILFANPVFISGPTVKFCRYKSLLLPQC